MGELGLDGAVKDISGALPLAELAGTSGLRGCILPLRSAAEAIELKDVEIYGVEDIEEVLRILEGESCEEFLAINRLNLIKKEKKLSLLTMGLLKRLRNSPKRKV